MESINWVSVLEQLIAGTFIAIAFGYFFPKWLQNLQKPKNLLMEADIAKEIKFEEKNGYINFAFEIFLTNDKKASLTAPVYWKLIIPKEIKIEKFSEDIEEDDQGEALVLAGEIDRPIYPNRGQFATYIEGSYPANSNSTIIFYEISSQFGLYPQKMRKFYDKVSGFQFSDEVYESFGKLDLAMVRHESLKPPI